MRLSGYLQRYLQLLVIYRYRYFSGKKHAYPEHTPGDKHGPTFDQFRVIAASYLFRETATGILIIASGGEATKDQPSIARVITEELISLGIPRNWIIEEDQSKDTHQQLKGLCQIIKARNLVEVRLISNEWHLPRIQAMVEWKMSHRC